MDTPLESRTAIESEIRRAFRGVTLGQGVSIRKAQAIDDFRGAVSDTAFASTTREEIVDDWSKVPLEELERDCVDHLDAGGFRYYIPALMLSVLNNYDPASMRVIGTLGGLYPKKGNLWEYHMHRYSLLNAAQKEAIARFLATLPTLIELDRDDQKIVLRALRNYWGQHLHADSR